MHADHSVKSVMTQSVGQACISQPSCSVSLQAAPPFEADNHFQHPPRTDAIGFFGLVFIEPKARHGYDWYDHDKPLYLKDDPRLQIVLRYLKPVQTDLTETSDCASEEMGRTKVCQMNMKKSTRDDIPVVDKIVRICSSLNNFCVPVVPFN